MVTWENPTLDTGEVKQKGLALLRLTELRVASPLRDLWVKKLSNCWELLPITFSLILAPANAAQTVHSQLDIVVFSCSCCLMTELPLCGLSTAALHKPSHFALGLMLHLIWALCFTQELVAPSKRRGSHTFVLLVFKVWQLLCKIIGWLHQALFIHCPGCWCSAYWREGSRWSPEVWFALFLLSSMSGNLLKPVNWQWKMSAVWRPSRWSAAEPGQVQ